jgi:hypothetical protein
LAGAIFIAALLFGFAHVIQDVHDMKRRMIGLMDDGVRLRPQGDATPPTPATPQSVGRPERPSDQLSHPFETISDRQFLLWHIVGDHRLKPVPDASTEEVQQLHERAHGVPC